MKTILTISYGRHVFDAGNVERVRMRTCAGVVDALHMIIFSKCSHGCVSVTDGALHLHPTNAKSSIGMLIRAYCIGSALLRDAGDARHSWIISAQDPFEAGLVGYLLSRRYGVPLQVQEHGDFFGAPWWRSERIFNRIRYVFGRGLVRRADCVRTVSKRVTAHLRAQGVDASRIAEQAVFTDVTAFQSKEVSGTGNTNQKNGLRALLPDAEVIILGMGRLVQQKDFGLLIRAFAEAAAKYPKAHLAIVGSGPEEQVLTRLVRTLDVSKQVTFMPWTDDVVSLMQSADIFALASRYEGWARVLIEAMAAGVPSVATEVGCVGEVFIDGEHGLVVPVGDMPAYARALSTLIEDTSLRTRYGASAARTLNDYARAQKPYAEAWGATFSICNGRDAL